MEDLNKPQNYQNQGVGSCAEMGAWSEQINQKCLATITYSSKCMCLSVSGAHLQSSVERPCPGESVTFTCTIPSNGHQWYIPFLNISRSLLPRDQGRVISDPPFQFTVTEVMTGTSITSTVTVNATADLNGILIVCRDGIGMLPEQSTTINILGKHGLYTVVQLK